VGAPRRFRSGQGELRELAQSGGGATAGRLQAMVCFDRGDHIPDLSIATEPGTRYRVRWVDVPDRDAKTDADTNYDGPGNITVSPSGGVILAEDGEGIQHLVGVTERGRAYALARNEMNGSEFAGPTFSADGKVLYANIQDPGIVFAITGPWHRGHNHH
jgi:hypothetical protein